MATAATRKSTGLLRKLDKRLVMAHDDWEIYTVDASVVRNVARHDEEFGNFATQEEFKDLIPRGEIWLGEKSFPREGICFVVNALTRLGSKQRGASEERAYDAGIAAERELRERLTGRTFRDGKPHARPPEEIYVDRYVELDDHQFSIDVWRIDGHVVRSFYKTDYTEGGHGYVYPWVPKRQIWIEEGIDAWELPFVICHEYIELRLMRDVGLDYDRAHAICSKMEFELRKGRGAKPLLAPRRRSLRKGDLARITGEEFFEYVLETYLKTS